jgi:hypothetical protein
LKERERGRRSKARFKRLVAPLNIKKVKIGIEENQNTVSIGYYWDNHTVERITKLLREYNDLFPVAFLEMK